MQEIFKIKPNNSLLNIDLKDLWIYRELFFFLIWRDIKVRYKQTLIGILWAVLQPVLTTVVFTVIFSQVIQTNTLGIPYPLFALSGLLIWLFVNSAIVAASNSLIGNVNLVTKVYFPRIIIPFSATLAGLADFAIGLIILVALMIYYHQFPSWNILLAPVFLIQAILLTLSLGTFFAALNVRFRDVKFALPFALQVWMFLSPVFYASGLISEKWRFLFALNPLAGILAGFRVSLFGGDFDWSLIAVSVVVTIFLTFFSLLVFKQMEDDFADLI